MKVYRVYERGENKSTLAGTLDKAKEIVNKTEPVFRAQVLVTECELPNQKEELITAINGMLNGDFSGLKELRTWHGTARGGLKLTEAQPR